MPREYSHIKEYEKAIPELKEQVLISGISRACSKYVSFAAL